MSEAREAQQQTAGCLIMLGLLAILVGVVAMLGATGWLVVGGAFLIAGGLLAVVLMR